MITEYLALPSIKYMYMQVINILKKNTSESLGSVSKTNNSGPIQTRQTGPYSLHKSHTICRFSERKKYIY